MPGDVQTAAIVTILVVFSAVILFILLRFNRQNKNLLQIAGHIRKIAEGDFNQVLDIHGVGAMDHIAGALRELGDSLAKKADIVREFAHGNLAIEVHANSGEDKLGQAIVEMKKSLNQLVDEMKNFTNAAAAGNWNPQQAPTTSQGEFGKIISDVNALLANVLNPINEATQVLDKIASGNLAARMTGDYKGGFIKIKNALNKATENLDGVIQKVAGNALQLNNASSQIASNSQTLAQGTSEQASSLQEVSSSLQEMASMTKQNSKNTVEARNMSGTANTAASKGMSSMQHLSEVIERIKSSADETAKIVKTIDDIAFQTNLLALNAAVEAARAGESGKGFAVVAEEVRNLAMRSAEAAKTTASLIDESVQNAENGVAVNQEAVMNLEEITNQVVKVNQVIAEIAQASEQQTQGIDQVNTAIEQLNQLTQQNAANSEESAGTAKELSTQADEMRQLVSRFKLSTNTAAGSTSTVLTGLNQKRSSNPFNTKSGFRENPPPKTDSGTLKSGKKPPITIIPLDDDEDDILTKF